MYTHTHTHTYTNAPIGCPFSFFFLPFDSHFAIFSHLRESLHLHLALTHSVYDSFCLKTNVLFCPFVFVHSLVSFTLDHSNCAFMFHSLTHLLISFNLTDTSWKYPSPLSFYATSLAYPHTHTHTHTSMVGLSSIIKQSNEEGTIVSGIEWVKAQGAQVSKL